MHPFLNVAIKAATRAGKIISQASNRLDRLQIASKTSPQDFVTDIDKKVEEDIIETISRAYPKHCILAEESGSITNSDEEMVWIIDPIDGTTNFIHGFPQYCTSIAIARKGIIEHGVIYDPCKDELFTASKGSGAQLNGKKIRVSKCTHLEFALLSTGFGYRKTNLTMNEYCKLSKPFLENSSIRSAGSAALDLAYIASGRLDGYWEFGVKSWDIAAGSLLVKEAGGFISDFDGGNDYLSSGRVISGNTKIYQELLKVLTAGG